MGSYDHCPKLQSEGGLLPTGSNREDAARMKLLRDIAIRHLLTVSPEDTLRRASKLMADRGIGSAVAVENEQVAGIVTERDLLRAVAEDRDVDQTKVRDVMTVDVVSGAPGWDLVRAVKTMTEGGFRHLLVTEMNDPVGIISLRDLMDSMVELVGETDKSG
jgi:CBS domain-containing protein